jgi:hypothetical protein
MWDGSAMSSAVFCAMSLIAPVPWFHPRHHRTALKPLLNNTSHQITAFPRTSPEQRVKISRDQECSYRMYCPRIIININIINTTYPRKNSVTSNQDFLQLYNLLFPLAIPASLLLQSQLGSFIVPCSFRCLCISKLFHSRCGSWPQPFLKHSNSALLK